jgi:hypothetical protein
VSTSVKAPATQVWSLIADMPRMGEWSPETETVTWRRGATGPTVGARFAGSNRHGARAWSTAGIVTDCDEGRRFSFLITAMGFHLAEWAYDVEPTETGCEVTETWIDKRGGLFKFLGKVITGVDDRGTHNRDTMATTLARVKAAAENVGASPST